MPLRVRCRCGQELVVRYSEWVYVFLGVALLALVLNTIALVLLYFRMEGFTTARTVSAPPAGDAGGAAVQVASLPPAGSPAPSPSPPLPGPIARAPTPSAPSRADAPGPVESGTAARSGEPPTPAPSEPMESAPAAVDASLRRALESGEPAGSRIPAQRPLVDGGVLLRLLVLESPAAESVAGRVAAALLLDVDPRIQKRAAERLASLTENAGTRDALLRDDEFVGLASLATPFLASTSGGRRLLDSVQGGSGAEGRGVRAQGNEAWLSAAYRRLRGDCSGLLSSKEAQALGAYAGSAGDGGIDIVFAVDVSQSMSGPLEGLQREALWFLPAFGWALPGVRVGAVFYRDGVEKALPFSISPEGELLKALRELKAEGGGDVPEGVHAALEAAFALGRFHWREGASKHIVLVGDAPPPFEARSGLLALLRQASRQGRFHVHSVGVNPEEGRPAVSFFPEIARAGGGRAVTVTDLGQLGSEVFLCAFPEETQGLVRAMIPAIRRLFLADAS